MATIYSIPVCQHPISTSQSLANSTLLEPLLHRTTLKGIFRICNVLASLFRLVLSLHPQRNYPGLTLQWPGFKDRRWTPSMPCRRLRLVSVLLFGMPPPSDATFASTVTRAAHIRWWVWIHCYFIRECVYCVTEWTVSPCMVWLSPMIETRERQIGDLKRLTVSLANHQPLSISRVHISSPRRHIFPSHQPLDHTHFLISYCIPLFFPFILGEIYWHSTHEPPSKT